MTIENMKTHWPLNMTLSSYDPRPGEHALVQSDLFCSHGLWLACGVRLCDLSPVVGANTWYHQAPDGLLDYLLCREDSVLLAIHLQDRDAWYGKFLYAAGLPAVEITAAQFSQGDVFEILVALEDQLQQNEPSRWRCRLQPFPEELTEAMLREVLVERQSNGELLPTEYGMCNGLIRIQKSIGASTQCTLQTVQRLPELLNAPDEQDTPGPIPFEEVLRLYHSGVRHNSRTSAQLVREVMNMPMQDYLVGFPEELQMLQEAFSTSEMTYGEAACRIDKLLHSDCDNLYTQGVDLLRCLAVPPLRDEKVIKALRSGYQVLARLPESMVKRYIRPRQAHEIRSFRDCVSGIRNQQPAGVRLAAGTLASFFQGVGALAGSAYPQWLSQTLLSYLHLTGRSRYVDLLNLAEARLQEGEDPWCVSFGIHLLYLLLIEPFCLIAQKTKSNEMEIDTNEL